MTETSARPILEIFTLEYSKADLDRVPEEDRLLFIMATGLANDTQMLHKTFAAIVETDAADSHQIIQQANSAYAMLILRLLAGKMYEGWKLLSHFSNKIKNEYEPHMPQNARDALRSLRAYFNPKGKKHSLIHDLRDKVGFHSVREEVVSAYNGLRSDVDLGDYLSRRYANSLYYTTEIIQYEIVKNIAGCADHVEAVAVLLKETQEQTENFNRAIYELAAIFVDRYLENRLSNDVERFEIRRYEEIAMPYFINISADPRE